MSVSVYSLLRHAGTRVVALALVLCASAAGGSSLAQMTDGDLVRVFDGEALRDPTRPAGAGLSEQADRDSGDPEEAGEMNSRYRVSFIRAGGRQPMAVINGQQVRVGEEVTGARVLSIEAGVVELDVNGERRTFTTWRREDVRESSSGETTGTDTMNRARETDN